MDPSGATMKWPLSRRAAVETTAQCNSGVTRTIFSTIKHVHIDAEHMRFFSLTFSQFCSESCKSSVFSVSFPTNYKLIVVVF